tara:strand:+ start:569 stop:949 length:381 start_codon:yes stop_codon:yes gene_type:complete
MKKLIILSGLCLLVSSCGYDDYDECALREIQKCNVDTAACRNSAVSFCKNKFPTDAEKAKAKLEEEYPLSNNVDCKWNEEKGGRYFIGRLPDNKIIEVPCDLNREETNAFRCQLAKEYPSSFMCIK